MKNQNHSHHSNPAPDDSEFWAAMDMQQSFQPDGVGEAASEQVPFEQFELVSAYMDGEVTAQEQLQVERWLKEDPKIQALYADLGGLTESVKQMPVPVSCSAEKTLAAVMDKVQTQQRKRRVWGASAIAAGLAVAIGSVFVGARQPGMQFAQNDPESSPTSSLQIASSPTPSSVTVDNTVQDEPILERALILE